MRPLRVGLLETSKIEDNAGVGRTAYDQPSLFIAVAVPTLAVLLHFSSADLSLRRLEERITLMESRFQERLARIEDRFAKLEDQVTKLEAGLANLRAELYEKFALKQA